MNLPKFDENQFWIACWFMMSITIICVVAIFRLTMVQATPEYSELYLKLQYCQALEHSQELTCYQMVMQNVQHP